MSSPREVIFELMERAGHNSVSEVKGFLHAVSVVNIDIYIEHSLVSFEELQNSKNTIIYIAEP